MTVPEVLFVCVHNAGRSQMAAGLVDRYARGRVRVRSAGTAPGEEINPAVVAAMAEVGVDIGYQQAKGLSALSQEHPDIVITVCDRAREACTPCIEAPIQLHWSIPDPARAARRESDPIAVFRVVRDQLRVRVAMRRHDVAVAIVRSLRGDESREGVTAAIGGWAQHVRFATELGRTS